MVVLCLGKLSSCYGRRVITIKGSDMTKANFSEATARDVRRTCKLQSGDGSLWLLLAMAAMTRGVNKKR
ncbi:hypothetical protein VNO77_15824 [Canavalia gladiata]|uniref:Uncharacterized protein n=1 Tax=Canavalia gladiata TaxID=3824 RepID=A0AAN9M4Q1_CANGL